MALNWLARYLGAGVRRRAPSCRLGVECLEDRVVPATFTVTTRQDVVSAADGVLSLREAITRANTRAGTDVIVLPTGICRVGIAGAGEDGNATGDFDVTDTVLIRGAGASLSAIDARQLDRVFDVSGTAPSSIRLVLQGLTVRNGLVTGDGGGVRFVNADLVVRDGVVSGNRASQTGGGISNAPAPGTGNATLVRSTVARNVAGTSGGGLHVLGSSLLTVTDSAVRRNIATVVAGGIFAITATLTNCTVSGNSAGTSGGGIFAGTATLSNCTVSGNSAAQGGGIVAGTATLTNCTVSANSATTANGGGVLADVATLTNCTVSGNAAGTDGGGVSATAAALLNCTIVENSAHTGGGVFHNPGGAFTIRNTIVALNLVDFTGSGPDVSGDFTSQGRNLIGDGTGGTGLGVNGDLVGTAANLIDPKLGPLRNNGGRTQTHALLAGSPAIDRGGNAGTPASDQRGPGFPRRKDGNGDGIARVDIGAFEK